MEFLKNMNKLKKILILSLLIPNLTFGATAVGWNTPTITTGWIQSNLVNGVNQVINAIAGIFTSASSTFAGPVHMPSLSDGCLQLSSSIITSTGSNCGVGSFGKTWEINAFGLLAPTTTIPVYLPTYLYSSSTALFDSTLQAGGLGGVSLQSVGSGNGTLGFNSTGYIADIAGFGGLFQLTASDGKLIYFAESNVSAGQPHAHTVGYTVDSSGNFGIGNTAPRAKLEVTGGFLVTASSTINANATTTGSMGAGAIYVNGDYISDFTGTNLSVTNGVLNAASGNSSKWATSTSPVDAIYPAGAGYVGIGTSTPRWTLNVGSSTTPQISLTDNTLTSNPWTFRSVGNYLYVATASPTTYATNTQAVLSVSGLGNGTTTLTGLNVSGFATSTANVGFNITGGCYAVSGTCVGNVSGGSGSPGGTGSELQYRGGVSTFSPVTGSAYKSASDFLGIGTTTPNWQLEIASNTPVFAITDNNAGVNSKHWIISNNDGILNIGTSTDTFTSTTSAVSISAGGPFLGVATSSTSVTYGGTSNYNPVMNVLGTSTLTGYMQVRDAGATSFPSTLPWVPQYLADFVGNSNNYASFNLTNLGGGTNSSVDLVWQSEATADPDGDGEYTYYADCGLNGNKFNNSFYSTLNVAGAFYCYNKDGPTLFGNATTSSVGYYDFSTGQFSTMISRMRITNGGRMAIGTTTPGFLFQVSSSTATGNDKPMIAISDQSSGANLKHWTLSSQKGSFYISSSSDVYATSTQAAFWIDINGQLYAPETITTASANTGAWCYNARSQFIRESAVCTVSALKFKKDINNLDVGLTDLLNLRPVSYYKKDPLDEVDSHKQMGLIADEVATNPKLNEMLVTYGSDGEIQGFRYDQFTALLTKAIQDFYVKFQTAIKDLTHWNQDQDASLKKLEAENASQQKQIDELKAELNKLK